MSSSLTRQIAAHLATPEDVIYALFLITAPSKAKMMIVFRRHWGFSPSEWDIRSDDVKDAAIKNRMAKGKSSIIPLVSYPAKHVSVADESVLEMLFGGVYPT